jgi:haloalkane dehalogenase
MSQIALKRVGEIAYREAVPDEPSDQAPVLCLHGFPQSSYMWRHLLSALASGGRKGLAPDLPGFGDSPPESPGTLSQHVEAVERFHREIGLDEVVVVVHDTGGALGLQWACDHPDSVAGLVVSNTAFFPDLEWTEIAKTMRTEVQGEALVDSLSREGLATLLEAASTGIDGPAVDEYWKAFTTPEGRRAMLTLYRSFDLDALEPYQAKLGTMGVPALVLWGDRDDFLPRDYADRFVSGIPGANLVRLEGAGHFLFEDEPERCGQEVLDFLREAEV